MSAPAPRFRVFVFPACNPPGLEIIRSLIKSNKVEVFGGSSKDMEYDPARQLLKNYVECPWFEDPEFESKFKAILTEHDINVVFPAWDPLIEMFSTWDMPGVTFITPRADVASLLMAKSATYEALRDVVPVPEVYGEDTRLPAFAKPDRGSGSRGIKLLTTEAEYAMALHDDVIITEYLPGEEYTVDCLGDLQGNLLSVNVRQRAVLGQGVAIGTVSRSPHPLETYCQHIAEALRIEGPWFAQFREDAGGALKLLEVNARIGGSTGHTRLAGVNLPLMSVFLFGGDDVRVPRLRTDMPACRSLDFACEPPEFDVLIWDLDDTLIRKDGKADPDVVAALYDCHNRGKRQFLMSKNNDPAAAVERLKIPDFFERISKVDDKVAPVGALLKETGVPASRCVMVNDSYVETFEIQEAFPDIITLTPDAVGALGREPLS